jgi:hypothetical protein
MLPIFFLLRGGEENFKIQFVICKLFDKVLERRKGQWGFGNVLANGLKIMLITHSSI